jgi:uncharacterized membrane protein (DUF4010 family)
MDALLTDARQLATALAIGLLVGLDRERKGDSRGLRTFALVCLLGAAIAVLARRLGQPSLVAVGLALIGAIAIAAYWSDHAREGEAPTTSMVAMGVTGVLGLMCGAGEARLAVPAAIVVVTLLLFKVELQGVAGRLGRDDLIPILQFGALTFIALPLLPDRPLGPYGALNPYEVWLMVVLVAGVGLAGYLLQRFAGPRFGAPLAAVAGGLVSSTATSVVFARRARAGGSTSMNALLVMLSNLTMLTRLAVMAAIVQPMLLPGVVVIVAAAVVATLPFALWLGPRASSESSVPQPALPHPAELKAALGFGLVYGAVQLVSAWGLARLGEAALYAISALSGLTDVDAITLSTFRLFGARQLDATTAVTAIAIATVANLAFKGIVCRVSGTPAMGRLCGAGFAAMAAAIGIATAAMRHIH